MPSTTTRRASPTRPTGTAQPVVEERFHWVIAEAVLAAEALDTYTGDAVYDGFAERWWSEIDEHFVDR